MFSAESLEGQVGSENGMVSVGQQWEREATLAFMLLGVRIGRARIAITE
jgi:hypothetical protein